MRLNCPHCDKSLHLDDNKVPKGQRFKLACPQCHEPFMVEPEHQAAREVPKGSEPPPTGQTEDMEFYPPGSQVAFLFVHDPNWVTALTACLKEQDYYAAHARDQAEALRKIDATGYQLLFIEQSSQSVPVLQRIHAWAGIQRRSANVVLIGQEARSFHPNATFRNGVNGYFHLADSQNAPSLVQLAIESYNEHYKVWRLAAKSLSKVHV